MMLKIDSITRQFSEGGSTLTVLENLSFEIEPGTKVALMGASGAGKTTLLQLIGGLDKPTSGTIAINDIAMHELSERKMAKFRNKELGFIFQFHHLMTDFTALENAYMPGMIAGLSRNECKKRAQELLELVGVAHRAGHHPGADTHLREDAAPVQTRWGVRKRRRGTHLPRPGPRSRMV